MNKIECVNAVLDGKKGDWIPAGFWYHYDHTLNTYSIAQSHLRTFRETGSTSTRSCRTMFSP